MVRSVSVLLTVFSLLACPLTCMREAAAGSAAADRSAEACSCCSHRLLCDDGPDSPLPDGPPFPDDECANCLCHGALLTKNDLNTGAEAAARAIAFHAELLVDAGVAASQSASPAIDASPPDVRSGRLIRYKLQSLLL